MSSIIYYADGNQAYPALATLISKPVLKTWFMQISSNIPEYVLADIISCLLVLLALWRPRMPKTAMGVLFISAAMVNLHIALHHPPAYLDFADSTTFWLYQRLIHDYFSRHASGFMLGIAGLQCLAGLFMADRQHTGFIGLAGTAMLLLAIVPLAAGAVYPSSVLTSLACVIVLYRENVSSAAPLNHVHKSHR